MTGQATTQWQPATADAGRAGRVRFQEPQLPELDAVAPYYAAAQHERWYSNGGPNAQLLAARIASYTGPDSHAVLVNNATSGLMIALRALAGTPDHTRRYVIVPSFTFVATVDAIAWCGFEPLFCDVDPDSWHADPASVARGLARHGHEVAALLLCATFGTAPSQTERNAWSSLAQRAGLPLLIDSAAGFGSCDDTGRRLGTTGDAEVFSFHATKPFAIGEGGAVVSRHRKIAERCARLANFGFDADRQVRGDVGLNAKMSELHAAMGLAVFDRYDHVLASRRRRAARLIEALRPHGFVAQAGHRNATFQFVPVLVPPDADRDQVLARAAEREIELRTYYERPLHRLEAFADAPRCDELPATDALSTRALSLPMSNTLSDDAIDAIVAVCAESVAHAPGTPSAASEPRPARWPNAA